MESIIKFNRQTLDSVPNWIHDKDYSSPPSLFNYGLPQRVYHLINANISNELTECDIICFIIDTFVKEKIKVNYLEIGCSVGKTFYQISRFVKELTHEFSLNCLEIESINPVLFKLLSQLMPNSYYDKSEMKSTIENDKSCGFVKDTNKILTWKNDSSSIVYFEANEFDMGIWKKMNNKYNIIFSDAFHEPHALLEEYSYIKMNDLIDFTKFIYFFDDLEADMDTGKMWQSVKYIANDLQLISGQTLFTKNIVVNGWLGNNEAKHNLGVISNFDFMEGDLEKY